MLTSIYIGYNEEIEEILPFIIFISSYIIYLRENNKDFPSQHLKFLVIQILKFLSQCIHIFY